MLEWQMLWQSTCAEAARTCAYQVKSRGCRILKGGGLVVGLAFYCLYSLSLDAKKVNKEFLKRTKKPDVHLFFLSFFLSLFCQASSYVSTNINKLNGIKRNNRNL